MKIDGRCHCGYLKYEAEVDPEQVGICHCLDCQSFSGSAFRGFVPAVDGKFAVLEGDPSRYIKTAASGHQNAMLFCPKCGTHICSTGAEPGSGGGRCVSAASFLRECRASAGLRMSGYLNLTHWRSLRCSSHFRLLTLPSRTIVT